MLTFRLGKYLLTGLQNENFAPATSEIAAEYNITVDHAVHGYSGYVHSTYSPFYWPTTSRFYLYASINHDINSTKGTS